MVQSKNPQSIRTEVNEVQPDDSKGEISSDIHPWRVALLVEYQGTQYAGFQLQRESPTIQGELEKALTSFTGEIIRVRGASRTDSGAHAQGQIVDFMTQTKQRLRKFGPALNFFLPDDIRVRGAYHVASDFNSRRSALSRTYQYRILNSEAPSALRRHTHLWIKEHLDTHLMAEAALRLAGTHDFRPLASGHPQDRSAVRTVHRWEVGRQDDTVVIECEANGFLKQQIRKVNGVLVEIGKRNQPIALVDRMLENNSGVWESVTLLPAYGLCLIEVKYPEPALLLEPKNTGTLDEKN